MAIGLHLALGRFSTTVEPAAEGEQMFVQMVNVGVKVSTQNVNG